MEKGIISLQEAIKLDKFRQLRNDVSYRAARATVEESKEIQVIGAKLIERLKGKV